MRRLIQSSFAADDPFETLATDLVDDPTTARALASEIEALLRQALNSQPDEPSHEPVALILDSAGRVVSANTAARQDLGVFPGCGVSALGMTQGEFETLRARLAIGDGATLLSLRPPHDAAQDEDILMLAETLQGTEQIELKAARLSWPDRLDTILSDLYQLTQSEREIARDLLAGTDPGRIALNRGRSIGTVRQQIKSIQAKTGCRTQLRLQALLAQAAVALNEALPRHVEPDIVHAISLPMAKADRRRNQSAIGGTVTGRIGLRSFGDPTGLPCMVFHGCLYGLGELVAERQAAKMLGVHLFGPERPGYGQTAALPPTCDWRDHAELGCADARAAMDAMHVERAVIVAHDTGLMPALAFCKAHPERVVALVCVSPTPPVLTWAQSDGMPPQQRVFALAMLQMPGLGQTLVQLGLGRMRKLGAQAWPQAVFAGVPVDEAVARQPANLQAVTRAYLFNAADGAVGFQVDLQNQYRQWSELRDGLGMPVTVLHGTENRTTTLARAHEFMSGIPTCRFHAVEQAGHTLALSHYGLVLRAIMQAWLAEGVFD